MIRRAPVEVRWTWEAPDGLVWTVRSRVDADGECEGVDLCLVGALGPVEVTVEDAGYSSVEEEALCAEACRRAVAARDAAAAEDVLSKFKAAREARLGRRE